MQKKLNLLINQAYNEQKSYIFIDKNFLYKIQMHESELNELLKMHDTQKYVEWLNYTDDNGFLWLKLLPKWHEYIENSRKNCFLKFIQHFKINSKLYTLLFLFLSLLIAIYKIL